MSNVEAAPSRPGHYIELAPDSLRSFVRHSSVRLCPTVERRRATKLRTTSRPLSALPSHTTPYAHPHTSKMAASLRPTLMRQAFAAPAQRALTSAVMPAFRVQRSQPILKSIPRATFQTSAARHILPPLPQVIRGGVNDPAPTPTPHPAHGSYHWSFERCDKSP